MAMAYGLPKNEEKELFLLYKKNNDKNIRDEIWERYSYIPALLSKRFINIGIEYEDICQAAALGLLYAIERFDPTRGIAFATFATPTVMGEIRKYFRQRGNFIRVPRSLYEIYYKAEKKKRELGADSMSYSALSRAMNIPEEDIEKAYRAGDSAFIESLEYEAYADGKMNLLNFLGVEDDRYLMIEDKDFIKKAVGMLDDTSQKFIRLRYWKGLSQAEIGKILGMNQMKVSRLEKKILNKLHDYYFME